MSFCNVNLGFFVQFSTIWIENSVATLIWKFCENSPLFLLTVFVFSCPSNNWGQILLCKDNTNLDRFFFTENICLKLMHRQYVDIFILKYSVQRRRNGKTRSTNNELLHFFPSPCFFIIHTYVLLSISIWYAVFSFQTIFLLLSTVRLSKHVCSWSFTDFQ